MVFFRGQKKDGPCPDWSPLGDWVIPENIHTIPRVASWNSEGEGGFLGLEFRRRGGVTQFGIPKAWGGVSALNSVNFQRKDGESSA